LKQIPKHKIKTTIIDNLDLVFTKPTFQEQIFLKSYSNVCEIELLTTDETPFATVAFTYLLQHLYCVNPNLLLKLEMPIQLQSDKFLKLENDSCLQLNIISNDEQELSLFKILNKCKTKFGKQLFKQRLLQPTFHIDDLQKQYNNIERVMPNVEEIRKQLDQIGNVDQYVMKMKLQRFTLKDIFQLYKSIEAMETMFLQVNMEQNAMLCLQMVASISQKICVTKLENNQVTNLNEIKTNLFVPGQCQQIEEMCTTIYEMQQFLQKMVDKMNLIIGMGNVCKLELNKNNEEFYISILSTRLSIFQHNYERKKRIWNSTSNFDFSQFTCSKSRKISDTESTNSNFDFDSIIVLEDDIQKKRNQIRLTNSILIQLSEQYRNLIREIQEQVCTKLSEFCSEFVHDYSQQIHQLLLQIGEIDVNANNAHIAFQFSYCKPTIIQSDSSFVNAISLRHPIIEQVNKEVQYVANDISLGKSPNGIVLFGFNEVGKSSLMKSLALSVVMAQAGMFVPCSTFEFYPFENIFTRISNNDNLYQGQSSFKVEMMDVKTFVNRSNSNSLIIADEVAATTETASAICLVSAIIQTLLKTNCKFLFTTHLHEIANIPAIQKELETRKLQFCHLSVTIDENGNLVYNRKLQPGKCEDFYGLNICRQMRLPKPFLEIAEETKKELDGNSQWLVSNKTSRYNSAKITDACEICNDNKSPLETHHIQPQRNADENGFIINEHGTKFHKNNKYNLATLCHSCHKKEQAGEIIVHGWVMTSIGKKLQFEFKN
jgi:DNA mismatch repair protein MutS